MALPKAMILDFKIATIWSKNIRKLSLFGLKMIKIQQYF
jgi:hypothetical protein